MQLISIYNKNIFNLIAILLLIFLSCNSFKIKNIGLKYYNFENPDITYILPDTLHEISGISCVDSNSFACIQDENGILFIIDANSNKLEKQYTFHIDGDYEGIAKVENNMYILRSDGNLFEIIDYKSTDFIVNSFSTGIPSNNNEGLCYDFINDRLLIACKGKIGKGKNFKDQRVIYSFDLKTKVLSDIPVFEFNLQPIKEFAIKNNIKLPSKVKKNGKKIENILKLKISAICIHPILNKFFVLSATDYLLFVFNMKGEIEQIEQLNSEVFNKPEGITFFENGDMLISNEGQYKKPTLLRFDYIIN